METKQPILPVESIRERDIDLILLEELSTDNAFCEWFVKELGLPSLVSINGVWKSIYSFGFGETDILFSYNSVDKKIFILIENKLDASFQNEQFDRYLKRANEYIANKECDDAYAVLAAPRVYCENQNEFENYLTYEAIAERFELIGSKRKLFKRDLLKIGIEKLRRGYQPVNSLLVQKFWHSYWRFKEAEFPSLKMKEPNIVPHQSDWPMMYDNRLKGIEFYHKLGQGNADATFRGYSDEKAVEIKEILPDWAEFKKHSKSFSIRVFSGKVDRTKDFDEQIGNVEAGLKNLVKLRDWIIENVNRLQE